MDVQLKELIEKIKRDGLKIAEDRAAGIISDAQDKASSIVRKAQEEAERLREVSRVDADKAVRIGKDALRQAGRDLVLTVKGEIESLFDKIVKDQVAGVLDEKLLAEVIIRAAEGLSASAAQGMEIQLPEKDLAALEKGLRSKMSARIEEGLEIKPFKGLDAGFRIGMKDGSAFYDFSRTEIAGMLSRYLNPRLAQLLSE